MDQTFHPIWILDASKRYFGLVIRVPEVGGKRDNSTAGERSEIHHHYSTAKLGNEDKIYLQIWSKKGNWDWDGWDNWNLNRIATWTS